MTIKFLVLLPSNDPFEYDPFVPSKCENILCVEKPITSIQHEHGVHTNNYPSVDNIFLVPEMCPNMQYGWFVQQ